MDLTALAISPNDRVLHYPCGDGSLCRAIAALVPLGVVVGLDTSDDSVRAARAAARDLDNVMFVFCDGREIPWNQGFFSHAIVDADLPVDELFRVLADGGRLFMSGTVAVKESSAIPADFRILP